MGFVYGFDVINSASLFSRSSRMGFWPILIGASGMIGIVSTAIRLAHNFHSLKDKSLLRHAVIGGVVVGIAVACYPIVGAVEFSVIVIFSAPLLFGLIILASTVDVQQV